MPPPLPWSVIMDTNRVTKTFNFDLFGPVGIVFTIAYRNNWGLMEGIWKQNFGTSLSSVLPQFFTQSHFWHMTFKALEGPFRLPSGNAERTWHKFRHAFSIPLIEWSRIDTRDTSYLNFNSFIGNMTTQPQIQFTNRCLCGVSYGPFNTDQLEYMDRECKNGFELGAGSGYLIDVLRSRGLNVIGVDSNVYKQQAGGSLDAGIMYGGMWSTRLIGDGFLKEADESEVASMSKDRTLIISWPMPGSDFPYKALKAYREAGGKKFIFKLGGLIGTYAGSKPTAQAGLDILNFFDEIGTHWGPAKTCPEFDALMVHNNLWSFEILDSPRK
jgi:hypothetical protein